MGSLGSLGTQRDAVELDFDWFGATIRVHPDASDLQTADMMMQFGGLDLDDDEGARAAMESVSEHLLGQIHPEDRDEFWRLAKANRQQMADIIAVSKAITEAVAGFPTGQPSDSTDTPKSMSKKSSGGSSSAGRAQRRAQTRELTAATQRRHQVQDQAAEILSGRPDLRLALYRQRQEQDAAEGVA